MQAESTAPVVHVTEPTERKYALHRLAAGDYLLPANDARTLWRIHRYEDGPSHGIEDWPRDRMFWGLWKYDEPMQIGRGVDTEDWNRWELIEGTHETRAESIKRSLEINPNV